MTFSGSPRRCGGQGDILAGALAVFYNWMRKSDERSGDSRQRDGLSGAEKMVLASVAASSLLREAGRLTFMEQGRGMIAGDILQRVPRAFEFLFVDVNNDESPKK